VSRKHIVVILVLVVSLSFVGTACGGSTSSPEGGAETVTIGTSLRRKASIRRTA
jgi:hypothetical protein